MVPRSHSGRLVPLTGSTGHVVMMGARPALASRLRRTITMALTRFACVSIVRGLGMSSASVRTLKSCALVALLALNNVRDTGGVMVVNQTRRYFSDGVTFITISQAIGESYVLNDRWHVAIKGTLLEVN